MSRHRQVYAFKVSRSMRAPRPCGKGWFYIGPNHIEIYDGTGAEPMRITKRQLVSVLKVMNDYAADTGVKP